MKTVERICFLFVALAVLSCNRDDSPPKTKIVLLKKVEVDYPGSSLADYSLAITYRDDQTIHTVTRTLANNSQFQFTCDYENGRLAMLTVETPVGSVRTVKFGYTPQGVLASLEEQLDGSTTAYEINYNANENRYSTVNKSWFFDPDNNFEGYYFMSVGVHTFQYTNAKGIGQLDRYIPLLIYETLSGLGFTQDFNNLSPHQLTESSFEELGVVSGEIIEYRYENTLDGEGNLGATQVYVNDQPQVFFTRTYEYEVKFQ